MTKLSPATQARLNALDPQKKEAMEFIRLLARDGVVAFLDGPVTARRVVFRLHRVGIGIAVRSPNGEHLGLFANPVRAVLHGFDYTEREAAAPAGSDLDKSDQKRELPSMA